MIQIHFLLLISFFIFLQAQAAVLKLPVVVRDDQFLPVTEEREIAHIMDAQYFATPSFKIVYDKEDEPIRTDFPDLKVRLRAATVLYHLERAKSYFIHQVQSEYVSTLPQITIRLEITSDFDKFIQFSRLSKKYYNNAKSVISGKGNPRFNIKPWGEEIWFRPPKQTHISELTIKSENAGGDLQYLLETYRRQNHMAALTRLLSQLAQASEANYPGGSKAIFEQDNLLRLAGTSLFIELIYQYSDPLSKLFSRRYFQLDAALVPEVIYHEFSHIALGKYLVVTDSTPVIEGLADFFATLIADSPYIATQIKPYNTFKGKNALNDNLYKLIYETQDYANADLVLSLIWELQRVIGKEKMPLVAYTLATKINTYSYIKDEFVEAVLSVCDQYCSNPFLDKIEILKTFDLRGL